ncbi:ribosome-binding protein aMBF1 (putative translation factor) [Streptacidiphilus sp. MAP12-16]|uniref:helix-turn-helix domain-containing protein n=1 Tax=Streptacidiphilus sp. MAP12-16 TaxID=3156300 RepID=UPI003511AEEB
MSHARWKTTRERKLIEGYRESAQIQEERAEIRLCMAIAKVIYDRRVELGLSQSELAQRAGLTQTQSKVSRIEGADAVPTLPLLRRLTTALDGSLSIVLDGNTEEIRFVAHAA